MARQLTFALPVREALGREDFIVSPANAAALAMLDRTDTWPDAKALLLGPKGAGKTHLAHVWAGAKHATISEATELRADTAPKRPLVVENVDRIAQDAEAQEALFHLHNAFAAAGQPLLLTATRAPRDAGFTLPDLQSRLQAAQVLRLDLPDDALLAAVLQKQFTDRQIDVDDDVIRYLTQRMERSFDAARALVAALDDEALVQRRAITKRLAAAVLDKTAGQAP